MKIAIPKKIKIGIHTYSVEFNSLLWYEESLKGSVNHLKQVIQIDPVIAETQKCVTFLHEVIHVINDNYRCKLDDDEVDRIAEGIAELLKDNFNIDFDWRNIK